MTKGGKTTILARRYKRVGGQGHICEYKDFDVFNYNYVVSKPIATKQGTR